MSSSDSSASAPHGHSLDLDWMTWRSSVDSGAAAHTTPVAHVDDSPDPAATVATTVVADSATNHAAPQHDAATTQAVTAPTVEQRVYVPTPVTVRASPRSPSPPFGESPSPGGLSAGVLVTIGALSTIVVLAVGAAVWGFASGAFRDWGSSDGESSAGSGSESSTVTACGTTPSTSPTGVAMTSTGLAVTVSVTSSCSSGDILGNSDSQVVVSSPSGVVASGNFDFSAAPIAIPAGSAGRQVSMIFPTGSFFAPPGLVADAGASGLSVSVRGEGAASGQELPADSSPVAVTSSTMYIPPGTDIDQTVASSLSAQASADRSEILSSSNNQWVAQLSSKQPGLVADGKTWTNQDILDEFASFYQRFSGTRLLWSDEWPVFSSSGWWVTITSQTFPSPQAAVSWCAQQGFDRDHCLGKLISTTAQPEGTTAYLP